MNLAKQKKQSAVSNSGLADAIVAPAVASKTETPDAVLVTSENSQKLINENMQFLSPVKFIQDRLQSEFSPDDPTIDHVMKDLRPIGIVVAIVFSVAAWTFIVQILAWTF